MTPVHNLHALALLFEGFYDETANELELKLIDAVPWAVEALARQLLPADRQEFMRLISNLDIRHCIDLEEEEKEL